MRIKTWIRVNEALDRAKRQVFGESFDRKAGDISEKRWNRERENDDCLLENRSSRRVMMLNEAKRSSLKKG